MSMNSEPISLDLDPAFDDAASDGQNGETTGETEEIENRRELSDREYDTLEDAVMQTARGRTFLREHARRNRAVASDLVMRALDDCRSYFKSNDLKSPTEILTAELQSMSDAISDTRRDIAAIKPKEGANNRIMAATEDLDAIVTATERATNDILTAAERIQETSEAMRENGPNDDLFNTLEEDIINIFLACSFQDITGQRTTKVVNALHYLEQRVGAMIEIWGSQSLRVGTESEFVPASSDEEHAEAGLLNGPALDGQGVDQADIDKLLNGDIEQLLAVAKDADEKGLGAGVDNLDATIASTDSLADAPTDPTDGIDFDAVPQSTAAAIEAIDDQVEDFAQDSDAETAEEGNDYTGLSEEADADTIDAIFNC